MSMLPSTTVLKVLAEAFKLEIESRKIPQLNRAKNTTANRYGDDG